MCVVIHYCDLSRFFWLRRYLTVGKFHLVQINKLTLFHEFSFWSSDTQIQQAGILLILLANLVSKGFEVWTLKYQFIFTTTEPMGDCAAPQWFGDNYCDDENNTPECGFDGGDCCDNEMEGYTNYCSACECLDYPGKL